MPARHNGKGAIDATATVFDIAMDMIKHGISGGARNSDPMVLC